MQIFAWSCKYLHNQIITTFFLVLPTAFTGKGAVLSSRWILLVLLCVLLLLLLFIPFMLLLSPLFQPALYFLISLLLQSLPLFFFFFCYNCILCFVSAASFAAVMLILLLLLLYLPLQLLMFLSLPTFSLIVSSVPFTWSAILNGMKIFYKPYTFGAISEISWVLRSMVLAVVDLTASDLRKYFHWWVIP